MPAPRALYSLLAVILTLPGPVVARGGPQEEPPVFGAGVTLVTLPVFVSDKQGQAVGGLTAGDFEVQDEGRTVRVVGFQEVDAGAPSPVPGTAPPRLALAARRQFLLLFDLSFTSVGGIVRSREAAQRFVRDALAPSDLAAVATFSVLSGLRLLVGFTTDRGQLAAAIETLGARDVDRRADPLGLTYDYSYAIPGPQAAAEASAGANRESPSSRQLQDFLRAQQVQLRQADDNDYRRKVQGLMNAMAQLGQTLDAIQGRKQVIYLSAGFEEKSLVGAQGDQALRDSQAVVEGRIWEVQSESRFGDAHVRSRMEAMLRALASSDTVVHAIDVTGLASGGDAALEGDIQTRIGAGRESLSQIADGTGGRFYKDTNDLSVALDEILDATRRYYVLAFEPESLMGPGKYHKLKVKVRGGHKVSHRTGYTEAGVEPSAAVRQIEAAEAIAKGVSGGPIALEALAVPYRNAEGRVSVPVVLQVDGKSLLERGPGVGLPLEVFGYAFDQAGRVEDMVALVSRLELAKLEPKLRESGLLIEASFSLPPGRHSLRFMVRDSETQRRGFHALEVEVPPFEGGERLLYPPLFMDDPERWLVVQAASRSGAPLEAPLRVGEEAFTPRMDVSLANGRTQNVCVMTYDGGKTYEAGAQFQIGAQLIDSGGNAVRIGSIALAKAVAETDGFRRFVLSVTPQDVPPGEYTFKVKLTDPGTGAVSEAIQPVRVE